MVETATGKEWVSRDNLLFRKAGNVLIRAGLDVSTEEFRDFEVMRCGVESFLSAHVERRTRGTLVVVVATVDAVGGELHVHGIMLFCLAFCHLYA